MTHNVYTIENLKALIYKGCLTPHQRAAAQKEFENLMKEFELLGKAIENNEMPKRSELFNCPVCGSENIKEESTYKDNGIYGPGAKSWKIDDLRSCGDCGVIFRPIKNEYDK